MATTRIDHFEVDRVLGKGGSGTVHLALDTTLRRRVALKLIKPRSNDPELEERFIQEAQAHARLRSPHVVQLHSVGRVQKPRRLYFAMELVNGESLDAILERGDTLEPERARQLLLQAACGLRDAHRAGIVHRDVKPSNLLVEQIDGEDCLKIADFGLAKSYDLGDSQITKTGTVMGTPYYIAPEQAVGDAVDFRSDLYALGCSFFHLLAGVPPFDGSSALAVMTSHVHARRPSLRAHARNVPVRLAAVIERMMARDPGERFASHDELIDELHACAPLKLEAAGVCPRAAAVVLNLVMGLVLTVPLGVWGLVIHLAYVTFAHAYSGQTLGKYLMRIQVVRADGRKLGLRLAALRTLAVLWYPILGALLMLFGSGPSALAHAVAELHTTEVDKLRELAFTAAVSHLVLFGIYALGLLFAAMNPLKLGVHDVLLGTRVVYKLER